MPAFSISEWKIRAGLRGHYGRAVSPVKLLIALGCLVGALYLLGPSLLFIESNQAVTNAPVQVVRSPIAGMVSTLLAEPGRPLGKGDPIAVVVNDYWDPAQLFDADNRLIDAERQLNEARREAGALRTERMGLLRDQAVWVKGMRAILEARRMQAEAGLAAARARFDTASAMLRRYGDLAKVGAVNLQRLDE